MRFLLLTSLESQISQKFLWVSVIFIYKANKQATSTAIPLDKPVLVNGFGGMQYTSVSSPFVKSKMI
jgi:hypothetical protein